MNYNKQKYNIIASWWGFAEATFFFIVPDVFISYRALKGYKAALQACIYSVIGALIGGLVMYAWAAHSGSALYIVQHIPAITSQMSMAAHTDYNNHGVLGLMLAPIRGIPYKLYAVIAPVNGVSLLPFLIISVIARLSRFIAVALITATISKILKFRISSKCKVRILIVFWVLFYAGYFYKNL